jgi:type IV pilus assembly protein PilV
MPMPAFISSQRGVTLIEVLVTVIILSIGLLGIAGLQSRLQMSEMEAYQRAQALMLLNDMANRVATNRTNAANYVTGAASPLGAGIACPTTIATRQQRDAGEWCAALQGAAETTSGTSVGAMIGGRGCVEALGSGQYLVTVAWQGLTPLTAPPAGVACGANSYDGPAGSVCTSDRCRRVVTTIVRVAAL